MRVFRKSHVCLEQDTYSEMAREDPKLIHWAMHSPSINMAKYFRS